MLLREVRHPHLQPRFCALTATTASTVVTFASGGQHFSAATSSGAGAFTGTFLEPFVAPDVSAVGSGVAVGSVGADIANGGFLSWNANMVGVDARLESLGAAGSGDDGTFHACLLGWDYWATDVAPLQKLQGASYGTIIVPFTVSATGVVGAGAGSVSVSKTGTGEYQVTVVDGFGRGCIPMVTPVAAAQKSARVLVTGSNSFTVLTFDVNEAAQDNAFHGWVIGYLSPQDQSLQRDAVWCPRNRPVLLAYSIIAGALDVGVNDGSLVVNGTGDYTLTFGPSVRGEAVPVVMAMGNNRRIQLAAAPTASAVNILSFNAGGSAADADLYVMAMHFSDEMNL